MEEARGQGHQVARVRHAGPLEHLCGEELQGVAIDVISLML